MQQQQSRKHNKKNNKYGTPRDILFILLGGTISTCIILFIQTITNIQLHEQFITSDILGTTTITTTKTSQILQLLNQHRRLGSGSSSSSSNKVSRTLPHADKDDTNDGFHPIYVFSGQNEGTTAFLKNVIPTRRWLRFSNIHNNDKENLWYSQHGQDIIIAKLFHYKESGYFIDLAANHPLWASNTFALEINLLWNGICIEPNSIYWYELSAYRTNCHVVGAIVGSNINYQEVNVTLGTHRGSGPFGGIIGTEYDNKPELVYKNKKSTQQTDRRYTISLVSILEKFVAPSIIDYLSLDVEGAETLILEKFPFHKYIFLTMTIERPNIKLRHILQQNGYHFFMTIHKGGDTLWIHQSIYEQAKQSLMDTDENRILLQQEMKQKYVNNMPKWLLDGSKYFETKKE